MSFRSQCPRGCEVPRGVNVSPALVHAVLVTQSCFFFVTFLDVQPNITNKGALLLLLSLLLPLLLVVRGASSCF